MVHWTATVVAVRTTHDDSGHVCGDVVTGSGATSELALAALQAKAEEVAQKVGQHAAEQVDAAVEAAQRRLAEGDQTNMILYPGSEPPADMFWEFEVVDVRLTPGPIAGRDSGWLAYGTLTWVGKPPAEWKKMHRRSLRTQPDDKGARQMRREIRPCGAAPPTQPTFTPVPHRPRSLERPDFQHIPASLLDSHSMSGVSSIKRGLCKASSGTAQPAWPVLPGRCRVPGEAGRFRARRWLTLTLGN